MYTIPTVEPSLSPIHQAHVAEQAMPDDLLNSLQMYITSLDHLSCLKVNISIILDYVHLSAKVIKSVPFFLIIDVRRELMVL